MSFFLSAQERIARARADLRMGVPVLLSDGDGAAVALSAEMATPERITQMATLGALELAVTRWRAETLKARCYDGDVARLLVPGDAKVDWIRSVADPASDLRYPMKGPFRAARDGSADLHRAAIRLTKDAHLLPAALVVRLDKLPRQHELSHVMLADLATHDALGLQEVSAARVPLSVADAGRVRVFRPGDGSEEHYVVEIGNPDRTLPVLSRLHSACFTGDVIGSLKCDCGPQLQAALAQIGEAGSGILLYLNQEGRGIGLANKMRAYALQDQGFDTVEANHRLGFEDDERDFRIGAEILKALGFSSVCLMTNNPAKITRMEENGISVAERVPLKVGLRPENAAYLATKAAKSGHLL